MNTTETSTWKVVSESNGVKAQNTDISFGVGGVKTVQLLQLQDQPVMI